MARETAAQRVARQAAEYEARVAAEQAAYPTLLMTTLARVSKQWNMGLKVRDEKFVVSDRNNVYELAYSWSRESQNFLQELEWELDDLEEAEREAKRRDEVKREALRKAEEVFTAEERQLLGL